MSDPTYLTENQSIVYLEKYGIPYPDHAFAATARQAVRAAETLGFPLVMKIISPGIIHKSDARGVETNIDSPEKAGRMFEKITERAKKTAPEAEIHGVILCSQAEPGVEMIVGGIRDAVFGPTVMCGLGGIFTEVYKDVGFRVAPVDIECVKDMIRDLKGYPLLTGARGAGPADIEALARVVQQAGRLMLENPDITELDLNPVRVFPRGAMALDALVVKKSG